MPLSGQKFRPGPVERESVKDAMARASSETHAFNAKERVDYINTMVDCIKRYKRENKTLHEIKELLPEFVEQYKSLFETLTNPAGYDESNLTTMLNMLKHMDNGNLSQHGASVIVGKRLYEKYGLHE